MLEKWKLVLDKGYNIGAIFMDLSKAFDTLNHELILAKLKPMDFLRMLLSVLKVTCLIDIKEPT